MMIGYNSNRSCQLHEVRDGKMGILGLCRAYPCHLGNVHTATLVQERKAPPIKTGGALLFHPKIIQWWAVLVPVRIPTTPTSEEWKCG
jgi:hypothetical protein